MRSECSFCSTSLSAFDVGGDVNCAHSNRCVAISLCHFNLHFPDEILCEAFFLSFPPVYLLCGVPTEFWIQFLIRIFVFSLSNFKSSFYILSNSSLPVGLWESLACLIFLLTAFHRAFVNSNQVQFTNLFSLPKHAWSSPNSRLSIFCYLLEIL